MTDNIPKVGSEVTGRISVLLAVCALVCVLHLRLYTRGVGVGVGVGVCRMVISSHYQHDPHLLGGASYDDIQLCEVTVILASC